MKSTYGGVVVELLPFPVLLGRRGCTFLQTYLSE